MTQPSDPPGRVRFGPFELDPRTGELHSNGAHVILSEQPLRLLLAFWTAHINWSPATSFASAYGPTIRSSI